VVVKSNSCLMVKHGCVVALLSHTAGVIVQPMRITHCNFMRFLRHSGRCGIDDTTETPKVVNLLENIRRLQEAVIRYRSAGYYGAITQPSSEDLFIEHIDTTPVSLQSYADISLEDTLIERDGKILIPIYRDRFDSSYGNKYVNVNGISASSQNIEEAVQLLHLLAEDDAFRNQFLYGKEGRDHRVEAGQIVPIEDKSGPCYCMGTYWGEGFNGYTILSNKESLERTRDHLDQVEDINYPIVFDYTGFENELDEIGKILGKYYAIFFNNEPIYDGKEDDDEPKVLEPAMDAVRYDSMLQELDDAGAGKLQAELQRQLDEWLAANPDWLEQTKPAS